MKTTGLFESSVNIVKENPRALIAHRINSLGREVHLRFADLANSNIIDVLVFFLIIAFKLYCMLFFVQEKDDAFFICDLGDVVKKYKLWYSQLPRVTPFYGISISGFVVLYLRKIQ